MTFKAFVEKWSTFGSGTERFQAEYCDLPISARIDQVDSEIAEMETDLPRVTVWESVPLGAVVFVRWGGGNRGLYLRHEDGLGPYPAGSSSYRHPLPLLGPHRMDARAWVNG